MFLTIAFGAVLILIVLIIEWCIDNTKVQRRSSAQKNKGHNGGRPRKH
jgi:hypothetical protein